LLHGTIKWYHRNGRDRHPSFGINMLLNDNKGVYNCFACGKKGTVEHLINDYCKLSGAPKSVFTQYLEEVKREYNIDISKLNKEIQEPPTEEVALYNELKKNNANIYHYLFKKNNIWPTTLEDFEVVTSPDKAIFPVKNRLDKTLFYVYRWLNKGSSKYTVSKGARVKSSIYGMDHIKMASGGQIIVVEGILDVLYLDQIGFNAAGIFGICIEEEQIDILRSLNPSDNITVIFDDDDAGREGIKDAKKKLSKYFYKVNTAVVPAIRMLDKETVETLTQEGGNYVREYF